MSTINTFRGLGDPGYDRHINYDLDRKRKDHTVHLMRQWNLHPYAILDVAGPSKVGEWIAEDFGCKIYPTIGDLDFDWKPKLQHVDTVICLEVIEHLLNPLKFLVDLRDKVLFDHLILSWPHRPSWLWPPYHFQEYDIDRFNYLIDRAGYYIANMDTTPEFKYWWQHFQGIRPVIRYFVSTHYFVHLKKST